MEQQVHLQTPGVDRGDAARNGVPDPMNRRALAIEIDAVVLRLYQSRAMVRASSPLNRAVRFHWLMARSSPGGSR